MNAIIAIIPIVLLFVLMLGIKMAGHKSALITLLVTIALALFVAPAMGFVPPSFTTIGVGWAVIEGVLKAVFPILIIILMAIFSYNVLVESKDIEVIKNQFISFSNDKGVMVLMLVWGFGGLLEGMAGFGTAVAIPAAILISLGYKPVSYTHLWGNGITPEQAGKKGDHLIGDFYVLFDKHYRAEVAELTAKFKEEGLNDEEAKAKAEQESPLMKEAHEMLVKWEANNTEVRALWEKMNNWVYAGFDETYKALGVGFDKIYYESNTYLEGKKKVEEGLAKGLFIRKADNSVWADLTNEGLDQKLLLRSDGTSVYMTQDIGTAEMRFKDYPIDKMIYVVGNEQNYHFQVLSILLDRLGFKWGKDLVHFSYGMVELPNGKMKSREGTVVDADDLVASMIQNARALSEDKMNKLDDITEEEKNEIARIVGLGALKYFILKVDARKNMLFNPEESIDFNGNTGPFIQYTYARIRSILRKAAAQSITIPKTVANNAPLNEKEIALIQKMNDFGAVVVQAGIDYSPSGIANYCYELTKEFNQFYHDYSILNADTDDEKTTRLVLAQNVAKVIKNGMELLGIEVPERM